LPGVSDFASGTSDAFKMQGYGKELFGSEMQTVSKGATATDNSSILAKLDELKSSGDTYVVFGVFSTAYGDHMVPLNDTAQNNSFKDSIVKSSENDTNWDNRFDMSNLKEIRYFKVTE